MQQIAKEVHMYCTFLKLRIYVMIYESPMEMSATATTSRSSADVMTYEIPIEMSATATTSRSSSDVMTYESPM